MVTSGFVRFSVTSPSTCFRCCGMRRAICTRLVRRFAGCLPGSNSTRPSSPRRETESPRQANAVLEGDGIAAISSGITDRLNQIVGDVFAVATPRGIAPTDAEQLAKSVRLFIDEAKQRGVSQAKLGTARLLYLALLLELGGASRGATSADRTLWARRTAARSGRAPRTPRRGQVPWLLVCDLLACDAVRRGDGARPCPPHEQLNPPPHRTADRCATNRSSQVEG